MPLLQQTGSRRLTLGDRVQLNLKMLQTKYMYQINPRYTSLEIFDENLQLEMQTMSGQTGSRHTMDPKMGDTLQIALIILQTNYQIKHTQAKKSSLEIDRHTYRCRDKGNSLMPPSLKGRGIIKKKKENCHFLNFNSRENKSSASLSLLRLFHIFQC